MSEVAVLTPAMETERLISPFEASLAVPEAFEVTGSVEMWDESDLWDDDTRAAAHEGAAEDLKEYVRSEAEQQARNEIAAKALNIIVSALESKFTDEGRRLRLVTQLVAHIGSLCNHNHLSEALDKHDLNTSQHSHDRNKAEDDTDDEEGDAVPAEKRSWFRVAKHGGSTLLKHMLAPFSKRKNY